jgi:tetratricopeptide (TPR) repeat protein
MCISPSSPEFEPAVANVVEYGLAVARGNTDPQVMLRYAEALWNVRGLDETITVLDRLLAAQPDLSTLDLANAYALRAICHMQRGELEPAFADVSASLQILPRAHPRALRGLIHSLLGRMDEAVADVRAAVERDPYDDEVRAWKGIVLVKAGEYGEAIEDLTAAIGSGARDKSASECHLARARARLALGDPGGAEDDCNRCIELDYHEQAEWPFIVRSRANQAHQVYLLRARARLAKGEENLALGDCFFAVSINPADEAAYALRAQVYHAIGNYQQAALDLARVAYLQSRPCVNAPAGDVPQRSLAPAAG